MPRVAIITGGTSGIGRSTCERLLAEGRRVAVFYGGDEEAAERCRREFGVVAVQCDVGDAGACERAVREVEAVVGPVDILINNAGVTRDAQLHKMSIDDWSTVLRTDLDSVFNMSRLVIDGMRARGFGRIINIASINGLKGQFGQTNYSAAKAGVVGFSKALALESARKGVTVNVVCPGYIDTPMLATVRPEVLATIAAEIPMGRLGRPEEVARCVAFLASDDASYITGSTLSINGGHYMH